MTSVIAALAFVGFIAAGAPLLVLRDERARRRCAGALVAYLLIVTLTAGVSQRDLWPFSAWRLMVGPAPTAIGEEPYPRSLRLRAVDGGGEEHAVDYRAWQPLSVEELSAWLLRGFTRLTSHARLEVGAHLLHKAERGRRRALRGELPGSFDRIFGPLSAPYHLLHPRIWDDREEVPQRPFVGIRLYREYYDLETYRRSGEIRIELVYEYRARSH